MKKYKILKDFGAYKKGAVVQFSDQEAKQLLADKLVESCEPDNKKAPAAGAKAAAKAAALVFALMGSALLFGVKPAQAGDARVAVSTYPITEAATMAASASGAKQIEKLVVVNSSSTATLVTIYKLCASTTTVAAVLSVVAPASGNLVLDYPNFNSPLAITDMCARKADNVDYVYIDAHYR